MSNGSIRATPEEFGRIPPNAIDLEEAVLGGIMLDTKAAYTIFKILSPECFYSSKNQVIAKCCLDLHNSNTPIDLLSVTQKLKDEDNLEAVGGVSYIATLTDKIANTSNIEYHCRVVQEKWMAREVIQCATETINNLYDDEDVFDAIDKEQISLHKMITGLGTNKDLTTPQYLDQLGEIIEANNKGLVPGIPTGFNLYDKKSGGHQNGALIIYAARPGMGKSARMINEVYHQLKEGVPVVIHSIEMTGLEVCARLIALHLSISVGEILREKMDVELFKKSADWLRSMPLKIFTDNKLSDIERHTSIMVTSSKCKVVYVDYLQLINSGSKDRYQNVTAVSMALKQMAKKLEIPVVALAQLSRSVETRGGDRIPQLSDLRESGQIEQDADVVDFIYRPGYYEIEHGEDGEYIGDQIWFVNAKMRSGDSGKTLKYLWDGPTNKISPLSFTPSISRPNEDDWNSDGLNDETPF